MSEQEKKKENQAYEAYGTYDPNEANRANANETQPQRKALEPKPFLPKKGNYRGLIVYQKAECIYDITFYFAHHFFVERKDRTIDQVVQAARIRERMTAARLGYRNVQKVRIMELEAENSQLKARVAELEAALRQKGEER